MATRVKKLGLIVGALAIIAAGTTQQARLECSIASRKDGRVELRVRNASSEPVNGEIYPALILDPIPAGSGPSYWAPVDLDTGRPYGANQPRRLRLRCGEVLKVELAPGELLWDRSISSVWPNRVLRDVVPSGSYALHMEIQGPVDQERFRSSSLAATIDSGVVEFPPEAR